MRTFLAGIAALTMFAAAPAGAVVINFDDLAVGDAVTTQYAGFTFAGWEVATGFGETSAPNFAFNTLDVATVDSAAGFFSLSFTAGVFTPATVSVWSGLGGTGMLLGSIDLDNPPADPFAFASFSVPFAGTGRSVVVTGGFAQFGWDDVTFGVVPEPGTWAMLIAGFGLVGMAARRRRPVEA